MVRMVNCVFYHNLKKKKKKPRWGYLVHSVQQVKLNQARICSVLEPIPQCLLTGSWTVVKTLKDFFFFFLIIYLAQIPPPPHTHKSFLFNLHIDSQWPRVRVLFLCFCVSLLGKEDQDWGLPGQQPESCVRQWVALLENWMDFILHKNCIWGSVTRKYLFWNRTGVWCGGEWASRRKEKMNWKVITGTKKIPMVV